MSIAGGCTSACSTINWGEVGRVEYRGSRAGWWWRWNMMTTRCGADMGHVVGHGGHCVWVLWGLTTGD